MAKFVLATGMDDLDAALRAQYAEQYTVSSVSYLQGLTVLNLQSSDTVLVTATLSDSVDGDAGFLLVVEHLRRNGVRVIFLDHSRPVGDPLVSALIQRGVYDLLLSDELILETVFERIDHPATYGDVEGFLTIGENILFSNPSSRKALVWRKQEEPKEEEPRKNKRPPLYLGFRLPERRSVVVAKSESKIITVSGLPGAGVSFVALHLARALSKRGQTRLVEASKRPIYARWLHGPTEWDGANLWVHNPHTSYNAWTVSETLVLFTAVTSGPLLREVIKAARDSDLVTVVDTRLEDIEGEVDVLVVPPDPEKIARLETIIPRLLIINMSPPHLPIDPVEYAPGLWANTVVSLCPFFSEQSIAVITGQALEGIEPLADTWATACQAKIKGASTP